MTFPSRLLTTFGLIFLAHAGYSAHEHSVLYGSTHPLPLDITLETLVAVVLVIFGLVLGAEKPKPISWSAWAGEIERKGGSENPFLGLEERRAFIDIRVMGYVLLRRAKRKEFREWKRQRDEVSTK
ncbi:conserved hypothetical protein [Uncinocarpus reesii 1704]|uniref:Magnesium transporter n=1 Tax=Uncinocarpus reesii (strain UAMH 1704) TaxID=336963 RepID=C4JTV1_UNCRE|nr:uncharacterized protein UREG_05890 [Uncinocarpus reesii 1704]EEP81048.1 conserved hypothetical protein [Uncinocarpus reesii 1704]